MSSFSGQRLRVRRRQANGSMSNLFVRLSPRIAQLFHEQALLDDASSSRGWSAVSRSPTSACESGVEFLPLSITLPSNEVIYMSYNGGSILSDENADGLIELPGSLLPNDGIEYVTVTALPFVSDAETIHMEPIDCCNWELLEMHADFLESGGLLDQVSVVYPNQILKLWVGGQDYVSLRVLEQDDNSSVSSIDDDSIEHPVCFRLVASTQVIVTPKPRTKKKELEASKPLRVFPTWNDWSLAMKELIDEPIPRIVVPPLSLQCHEETLEQFVPGWNDAKQEMDDSSQTESTFYAYAIVSKVNSGHDTGETDQADKESVVCVLVCNEVSVGHAALHCNIRYQIDASPFRDHVVIRLLKQDEMQLAVDRTLEMVQHGQVKFALQEVTLEPQETAVQRWNVPYDNVACTEYRPVARKGNLAQVARSLLDSLPRAFSMLPFSPGCLISVENGHETLYRLMVQPQISNEQDSLRRELFLLLGYDSLALASNACKEESIQLAFRKHKGRSELVLAPESMKAIDNYLNLLPPTPNVIPDEFVIEEQSKSTNYLSLVEDMVFFESLVITGEIGSGKTHLSLVLAACARLLKGCATVYLDCKRLQSSSSIRMNDILSEITRCFVKASKMRPSIVILDDVDEIAPNLQAQPGDDNSVHHHQVNPVAVDQAKLISDHIRMLIRDSRNMHEPTNDSIVVYTCRDETTISPPLLQSNAYNRVISTGSLGGLQRTQVFSRMLECHLEGSHFFDSTYPGFAKKTDGFRPRDLEVLAKRVYHIIHTTSADKEKSSELLSSEARLCLALDEALKRFIPLARRAAGAEDKTAYVSWSEIGGLFQVKQQLTATILRPVKYSLIFKRAPIKLPRGFLLFGPPGCGKSHLVPGLAAECDFSLVRCRGPELLDKYIGASEAKVRQLFQRAYDSSPSILFLDEFDALAPRRGSDHTGVTDRVVNQLLTFLDGVEDGANGKSVYIIAATSRPDKVDPALLRPGRLEKHVFVGYPQSEAEWNDLFAKIVLGWGNVSDEVRELVHTNQLYSVAQRSAPQLAHFSAADLKAVLDTSHLEAVHEYLATTDTAENQDEETPEICLNHLLQALRLTRPSLSQQDRIALEQVYSPFLTSGQRSSTASGIMSSLVGYDGDFASGTPTRPSREKLRQHSPLKTALK